MAYIFSASAPVFAAVVSLLNGARLESGQRPLGFLNPFIYSVGFKGLTDIILGGSTGCPGFDVYSNLTSAFVPYASWNATEGWDPVTGYGTPNFRKLLELSNKFVPRSAGKYRWKFFATNSHGSPRGSYGAYN